MRHFNIKDTRELALASDAMNTVRGGVTMPLFRATREEKEYRIEVKVPGVTLDNLRIEIHNNQLYIFHLVFLSEDKVAESEYGEAPRLLQQMAIPREVDISKITASHEGEKLILHLPHNDMAGGYHRKVRIA